MGKNNMNEMLAMGQKAAAEIGKGIGGYDPGSYGATMGAAASDMADSAMMNAVNIKERREMQRAQEQAKKKGLYSTIGRVLGATIGSFTPLGPVAGSMVGGSLGDAGGQALAGGNVDIGQSLKSGVTSAATTAVAPGVFDSLGIGGILGRATPQAGEAGFTAAAAGTTPIIQAASKLPAVLQGQILQQAGQMLMSPMGGYSYNRFGGLY